MRVMERSEAKRNYSSEYMVKWDKVAKIIKQATRKYKDVNRYEIRSIKKSR